MTKTNEEALSELFGFHKKTDLEKLHDREAQYTPVKGDGSLPATGGISSGSIAVSDPEELSKRLTQAIGMAVGTHNVKTMAGKALKTFPIIISDDVDPKTAVMLKNAMEEQYASYLQLLISNEVINMTDLDMNDKSQSLALQALKNTDSNDFGTEPIAHKMQSGNFSVNDLGKNIPVFPLIKQNEGYTTNAKGMAALFENSIIVPQNEEKKAIEALQEMVMNTPIFAVSDIAMDINNISASIKSGTNLTADQYDRLTRTILKNIKDAITNGNLTLNATESSTLDSVTNAAAANPVLNDFNANFVTSAATLPIRTSFARLLDAIANFASRTGRGPSLYNGMHTIDRENVVPDTLSNGPSAIFDLKGNAVALNKSVADILSRNDPVSKELNVKFSEATYLLASKRISGDEYYAYLTDRLGIPVNDKVHGQLITDYPSNSVIVSSDMSTGSSSIKAMKSINLSQLYKNINDARVPNELIKKITRITLKDVWDVAKSGVIRGTASAGAGAGLGALIGLFGGPVGVGLGASVGAGVGALAGVASSLWSKIHQKMKIKKAARSGALYTLKSQGSLTAGMKKWQRVEDLIDALERNRYLSIHTGHSVFGDIGGYETTAEKEKQKEDAYQKYIATGDARDIDQFEKADASAFSKFNRETTNVLKSVKASNEPMALYSESVSYNDYFKESSEYYSYVEPFAEEVEAEMDPSDLTLLTESYNEILNEKSVYTISTVTPGQLIPRTTKLKLNDKYSSLIPGFATKGLEQYGSVDYDRKSMSDRRYNEPLIITVHFKDIYADDRSVNNQMTAVIGILGVITRVPSDEMTKVLEANTKGTTLGIFSGDQPNNAKSLISSVFAGFKDDVKNLPVSGKIWKDLSKVSAIAAANVLTGNSGNVANAHIVFSQKEIDNVKHDTGIDYLKDAKAAAKLMKRYSAFEIDICNDALQIVYTYSDPDNVSWDAVPYSAYQGKSQGDQLSSALMQISRQI